MECNRRTMIAGSALAGLAAMQPLSAFAAGRSRPALYIYDARFASSLLEAKQMAAAGVAILDPRQRDLGVAWRAEIPSLVGAGKASVMGMTLWSDRYICETFGRDLGFAMEVKPEAGDPASRAQGLREWVLA